VDNIGMDIITTVLCRQLQHFLLLLLCSTVSQHSPFASFFSIPIRTGNLPLQLSSLDEAKGDRTPDLIAASDALSYGI
jgi:hypothetical protein